MDALDWLQTYRAQLVWVVVVLAALVLLQRIIGRFRRRRPAQLNPKLQKYAGPSEAERQAALNIIATSSTGVLAGYEIVQQIEAVFVEGRRSPEEAMLALKAAAGRLGANAVINLSHQRTTAGRCTAQGDAVVVRPSVTPADQAGPAEPK